eukprot:528280-Amphidinium_carterae.1
MAYRFPLLADVVDPVQVNQILCCSTGFSSLRAGWYSASKSASLTVDKLMNASCRPIELGL